MTSNTFWRSLRNGLTTYVPTKSMTQTAWLHSHPMPRTFPSNTRNEFPGELRAYLLKDVVLARELVATFEEGERV